MMPIATPRIEQADLWPETLVWIVRTIGALAGSAIALAYLLPRRKREAFLRFTVGFVSGLVFGAPAGLHLVRFLGVRDEVTRLEVNLMGAAAVSLTAWWVLGMAAKLMRQRGMPLSPDEAFGRTPGRPKGGGDAR